MKSLVSVTTALTLALAAASAPSLAQDPYGDIPRARADFVGSDGESVGHAVLRQGPNGTLIDLTFDGVPPGMKAIHIHAVGNCADHDHGFMNSTGHLNPDNREHGLMNAKGPDAGDFPNFYVHDDGTARAQLFNERATLDGAVGARILDKDGAALLIHESPDDHLTQPIGGAGKRIACGVIEASVAGGAQSNGANAGPEAVR
jgi:Cu-Zn family superoxide dismutase